MRFHPTTALTALLFFSCIGSAEEVSPAPPRKAVAVRVQPPEYPAIARRYNISGTVVAKMRIEPDGRVSKVEIIDTPADVLSEAVIQAARKWEYQPMPEALEGLAQFPFKLSGDEGYAFSTDVRSPTTALPANVADLGIDAKDGWSHVRVLVNANGTVQSTYVLKASSDELKVISKKIIAPLLFISAPEGSTGYKGTTVNLFLINVTSDGAIRIEQKSGQ